MSFFIILRVILWSGEYYREFLKNLFMNLLSVYWCGNFVYVLEREFYFRGRWSKC